MKGELTDLQEQLETHKKSLEKVDDSIKRLNGIKEYESDHDNSDDESAKRRNRTALSSQVSRINKSLGESKIDRDDDGGGLKRKLSDDSQVRKAYSSIKRHHDSGDETPEEKIPKRKVSVAKSINTKEDLIKIQNKFSGAEQRNKRMFGFMLGTLKEFKTDDKERSSTANAQNRKELEKKIEVKKVEERVKIAEERKRLEKEKYRQMRNIQILEDKIRLTEQFDIWKKNQNHMKNCIRTQARPYLFYLPKKMDAKSEKLLEESEKTIEDEIKTKQKMIEVEIEALNAESATLNAASDADGASKLNQSISVDMPSSAAAGDEKDPVTLGDIDLDEDKIVNEVQLGEDDEENANLRKIDDKAMDEEEEGQEEAEQLQSGTPLVDEMKE